MREPAARAAGLRRSEIRVLFDAAGRRPDAIRLEVGEPSFTTPAHIIDAAARAAHAGHTGYGPNGGLLSLRELLVDKLELVDLASRRDLWLLSDEVYDEMVLDTGRSHTAAAPFDREGRVITVYSFSKVYAMTGWRVGYAVAPPRVAEILRTLQEPEVSCPSTISQKAAEAALTGPRQPIDDMIDAYRRRSSLAIEAADRSGLRAIPPSGTLYMMLDVSSAGLGDVEFALWLLDEFGVSVAPGTVFGPSGRGWVRISLAAEDGAIVEGVERIAAAVEARSGVAV